MPLPYWPEIGQAQTTCRGVELSSRTVNSSRRVRVSYMDWATAPVRAEDGSVGILPDRGLAAHQELSSGYAAMLV